MKRILTAVMALALCLAILTGCRIVIGGTTNQEGEHEIQRLLLTVDHAEQPVFVTIQGSKKFDGLKDMILGSDTMGLRERIIEEVVSCSDFGEFFSGNYSVSGSHLEMATVCFQRGTQKTEPLVCGVNYYDLILQAGAMDAEEVFLTYGKSITQTRVKGDFSFLIFPLSENCPMRFDASRITITGTVRSPAEVSLNWDGEKFTLSSDSPLSDITIIAESSGQEEPGILEAGGACMTFPFRIANGMPVKENTSE